MEKPILYISGAITGVPELNRPKFTEATKKLRGLGYIVINPHEICDGLTEDQWDKCMKVCIARLMDADVVIQLDDWKVSRGAKNECDLAVKVGIEACEYQQFLENIKNTTHGRTDTIELY